MATVCVLSGWLTERTRAVDVEAGLADVPAGPERLHTALAVMSQLFSGSFTATASAKFATPMIANGKVYAGTGPTNGTSGGSVAIFGLLNPSAKALRKSRAQHPRQNRLPAPATPHPGSSTPGE